MSQFNVPQEQQEQILQDRIVSLNLDGFQHELNREVALAVGDEEQAKAASEAIVFIQNAIASFEGILAGKLLDSIVEPVTDPELVDVTE
jgi:hypothetical protein